MDRPHILKVYNNNMGGVDLADMFAALNRIDIHPRRWYLRILYHLSMAGSSIAIISPRSRRRSICRFLTSMLKLQVPSSRLANRLTWRAGKEDGRHWKMLQHPIKLPHLHFRGSLMSVDVRQDQCDHFQTVQTLANCVSKRPAWSAKYFCALQKTQNCFLEYHTTKWHAKMALSIRIWDYGLFTIYTMFFLLLLFCHYKAHCYIVLKSGIQIKLVFISYSHRANVANPQHPRTHCMWRCL